MAKRLSPHMKLHHKALPMFAFTVVVAVVTILVVNQFQSHANRARDAEVILASVGTSLKATQSPPIGNGAQGLAEAHARADAAAAQFSKTISRLRDFYATPGLSQLEREFAASSAADEKLMAQMRASLDQRGDIKFTNEITTSMLQFLGLSRKLDKTIQSVSADYRNRASSSLVRAQVGSAAMILALLIAFALVLRRSVAARSRAEYFSHENERLLTLSRVEALTDALTGLPNRRALMNDLAAATVEFTSDTEVVLAMYDLDGFKGYNDKFGHPAGDALLTRLSTHLSETIRSTGRAYRIGGDEFCVVATVPSGTGDALAARGANALVEHGEGFDIGSSYGFALMPDETRDVEQAFKLADIRLYRQKATHQNSRRASGADRGLLLQVLAEQGGELAEHTNDVALLAENTARAMGLDKDEIQRIRIAAELHDIGKTAIPDSILGKESPLTEEEWNLIRNHTLIGERIVRAAPTLAYTAELVRSSHERVDGAGYPDGLKGDEIPLGARIIAVCDAFDAMVTDRPYRAAKPTDDAIAELERCTGTQFDANSVTHLIQLVKSNTPAVPVAHLQVAAEAHGL